jgi:hypothetical protein
MTMNRRKALIMSQMFALKVRQPTPIASPLLNADAPIDILPVSAPMKLAAG